MSSVVSSTSTAPPPDSLLARFGLSGFRPGQREVIDTVLAGQDCLCVMPTGGGKSLCYQLPALARPGTTLVVSPLIALMKDQVDQLHALKLRATFINSTLSAAEQYDRLDRLARGEYELVYVVPERFRSPRFVDAVQAVRLSLLAIDEAHCISEWGHDFRPDYARLGQFRRRLGNPPTIALTATATEAVRRDIVAQLSLHEPRIFITGFARPNLHYEVQSPPSAKRKDEALLEFLAANPGTGIVYASTRKRCEELAATIAAQTGRPTGIYHAGLTNEARHAAQDAFMQGQDRIVVATTAFGMGIDKADVRFVVHYNLPGSLEGYYQEAGRAGRDGHPSRCLMLFHLGDRRIQEFFIESAYPARDIVAKVYAYLRSLPDDPIERTLQDIKQELGLQISAEGVGTCEQLLEKAGVLERLEPNENMALVRLDSDLPTLVDLLPQQAKVQRRVLQALEKLVGRRRFELVYFQPRDLLAATELDAPALGRTLRELRQLKAFDYVPPFRGRAIHMLETAKRFDELEIDFTLLERRKAAEYEKLNRVIAFATTRRCRQLDILDYFGQPAEGPCENCDNCQRRGRGARATASAAPREPAADARPAAHVDHEAVLEAARVALSGVARTRARFGKTLVAQMLFGSKSAKITKFNLQRLSTYGLLHRLGVSDIVELLEALLAEGCLEQQGLENDRPVLHLTELGGDVMAGRARVELAARLPAGVCAKLRGFRAAPAAPGSPERTPPVPATAPLNEPAAPPATPPSDPPPAAPADPPPRAATQPTHYWTWRMLGAGFTVDECTAARGLQREVVLDHALRAIDAGWRVEARWFLTTEQLRALEQLIGPGEPARLRPLLAQLPPGLRYEDVQLFLKCRRTTDGGAPAVP